MTTSIKPNLIHIDEAYCGKRSASKKLYINNDTSDIDINIGTSSPFLVGMGDVHLTSLNDIKLGSTDKVSSVAALPEARSGHMSATLKGVMYIGGGFDSSNDYRRTFWKYNESLDTYTEMSLPSWVGRSNGKMVVLDDVLYVLGGTGGTGVYYNDMWRYNESGDNWVQMSTPSWSARSHFEAVVFNGSLYVFGGEDNSSKFNDFWKYSVGSDSWSAMATPSWSTRSRFAAESFGGYMYVFGGEDGSSTLLNDVWRYNGSSWTSITTASWTARKDHKAIKYNDKIFLCGGTDGSGPASDSWIYSPANDAWSSFITIGTFIASNFDVCATGNLYVLRSRFSTSSVVSNIIFQNKVFDVSMVPEAIGSEGGIVTISGDVSDTVNIISEAVSYGVDVSINADNPTHFGEVLVGEQSSTVDASVSASGVSSWEIGNFTNDNNYAFTQNAEDLQVVDAELNIIHSEWEICFDDFGTADGMFSFGDTTNPPTEVLYELVKESGKITYYYFADKTTSYKIVADALLVGDAFKLSFTEAGVAVSIYNDYIKSWSDFFDVTDTVDDIPYGRQLDGHFAISLTRFGRFTSNGFMYIKKFNTTGKVLDSRWDDYLYDATGNHVFSWINNNYATILNYKKFNDVLVLNMGAPTHFEIAEDGGSFGSSISNFSLILNGPSYNYDMRFSPQSVGYKSGNLVVDEGDTEASSILLSGIGTQEGGTPKIALYKLNDLFVKDRGEFDTKATTFYYYEEGKGTYSYDESIARFVSGGTDYTPVSVDLNVYDFLTETDVNAIIRTVEILPYDQILANSSSNNIVIKMGITKQIGQDGNEKYSVINIYEDAANVVRGTGNQMTLYETPEEVNDSVTEARVNGTRNFFTPQMPLQSQMTRTVSIELTFTNEGKIYDFVLVTTPRVEQGGDI